jgi:hypothetical protein
VLRAGEAGLCSAAPALQAEIEAASRRKPEALSDFAANIAPFAAIRERFSLDVHAHIAYQDAVNRFGVQGQLSALIREYGGEAVSHPESAQQQFLYGYSLAGKTTEQAVRMLRHVLEIDPAYAPAHRALAGIYSSERFRDDSAARSAQAAYRSLCPDGALQKRPEPLPEIRDGIQEAREIVTRGGEIRRVPDLVEEAFTARQWWLQRILPFDWYTVEFKEQAKSRVQRDYWSGWSVLVDYHSKTGATEEAEKLIGEMEARAARLKPDDAAQRWTAYSRLAGIYLARKQSDKAREMIVQLEGLIQAAPEAERVAELQRFRGAVK